MAGCGKPGRRAYVPDDASRKIVWALAAVGRPQGEIAARIGISDVTLRRFYRQELDNAAIDATLQVEQSVHWMATKGRSLPAAQFWLRNRGGGRWAEPARGGDESANGGGGIAITFQWADNPPEPGGPVIEGEPAE